MVAESATASPPGATRWIGHGEHPRGPFRTITLDTVGQWFEHDIVSAGRLPLFAFLVGLILGFLCIRISVRLIRAEVRWWFGNVTPGGLHVHHVVFGVVLALSSGVALIATFESASQTTAAVLAGCFGLGSALMLDEFALILYLRDVYWQEEGRTSVDAVFVAIAVTGLLLLGLRPLDLIDGTVLVGSATTVRGTTAVLTVIDLLLAAVVLLKGKIWTGLVGLFFFPLLLIGSARLARPGSPWARWRYADRPRKMQRALRRERWLRRPLIRVKIYIQDLMAGRPDLPHALQEAEKVLDRTVHAAPPPPRRPRSMTRHRPISGRRRGSGTINRLPGLRAARNMAGSRPRNQEYEPVEPGPTAAPGRQVPLLGDRSEKR
jgi:hypothetical protein